MNDYTGRRVEWKDIPLYEKGKLAKPLFDVDFMDELERGWGRRWGAQSDLGKLRMVMVHMPGEEETAPEFFEDPVYFNLPEGPPDLRALQKQQKGLIDILLKEGIDVVYLNASPTMGVYTPLVGIKGVRDAVVINGGAIIPRCAIAPKREIGVLYTKRLAEMGCPILYTVHGKGCFEGGNVVWIDTKHVLIGISTRTNLDGLKQVEPVLRMAGVEEIRPVSLPGYLGERPSKRVGGPAGFFHLDMVFSMVDERLGVIYPPAIDYDSLYYLQKKGIKLIEAPLEEVQNYGCNILALEPGKVVIPAHSHRIIEKLLKENVEVITLEMPELRAGGGPVCNTLPLIRDPGPSIS